MPALIVPYQEIQDDQALLEEIREIFFESSTKKDFKDEKEKEAFYEKYLGHYLKNYPELAYVALDKKVLGYIVAAPDSKAADLQVLQPHLSIFKKYFNQYPSHLHINCHHESRGRGVGAQLIEVVEKKLKSLNILGLHIMTGPDSLNRKFYQRSGFDFQAVESFHDSSILFMGKTL